MGVVLMEIPFAMDDSRLLDIIRGDEATPLEIKNLALLTLAYGYDEGYWPFRTAKGILEKYAT